MNRNFPEAPKSPPKNILKKNIPPKMRRLDASTSAAAINVINASLASMSGIQSSPIYIPGEDGPGAAYDEKIAQRQMEEEKRQQMEQFEAEREEYNEFETEIFDILQLGTEAAWRRAGDLINERKADPLKVDKKIKQEVPAAKQGLIKHGLEKALQYAREKKTMIKEQTQDREI